MLKGEKIAAVVAITAILFAGFLLFNKSGGKIPDSSSTKSINLSQASSSANSMEATTSMSQSGLKIEDIQTGNGPQIKSGDTVIIHYKGTLTNGTKFDSSYDRGTPFTTQIGVGQVIKGWDMGVIGMKVGGRRKLTIPPDLAYGNRDLPGIPANSTLIFELELLQIK